MKKEKFIDKAKKIHGDKYDYSNVNYNNVKTKIKIICPFHGFFEQKPIYHLRGHGCKKCFSRNLKIEEFINKAKKIHKDKYDYSESVYINSNTKIKIICPVHGIFEQKAGSHLIGCGCQKCGNVYRLTTEEFINKAKQIHGDKYDYTTSVYVKSHKKIKIICPVHGVFEQKPNHHLNGQGCGKCANRNINVNEFIHKAKQIHGDKYDYSSAVYEKSNKKIKIICPVHGIFEQTPNSHLMGDGCSKCSGKYKPTTNEFIHKAKQIHGDKYDYSKSIYIKSSEKISIFCLEHGEFKQSPDAHINQKQGCPFCKESKGERLIKNFLIENKIDFVRQAEFEECINPKTGRKLKFDFFLTKKIVCVEFDGLQHFKPIKKFGGENGYKMCVERDILKNNFCKKNKIPIFRIKYNENILNKIKKIIK